MLTIISVFINVLFSIASTTTVFTRNLPYHWTDVELLRHFESIGPVKRAFVVTEKKHRTLGKDSSTKPGQSRGFGFVEFALFDDAQRAVTEFNNVDTDGRRLRVEIAVKGKNEKPKFEKRKNKNEISEEENIKQEEEIQNDSKNISDNDSETSEEEDDDAGNDSQMKDESEIHSWRKDIKSESDNENDSDNNEDHNDEENQINNQKSSIKTTPAPSNSSSTIRETDSTTALLISGISVQIGTLAPTLSKLLLKPVLTIFPSPESTPKYKAARLVFSNELETKQAKTKLFGLTFPPDNLPIRIIPLPLISSRLIIRNLPFHINENNLKKIFLPFGNINQLTLPLSATNNKLNRGFGFILYNSLLEANKAMNSLNGSKQWGRLIAVDWSLGKNDFSVRKEMQQKIEEKAEKRKLKTKENKNEENEDVKIKNEEDEEEISVKIEDDENDGDDDEDDDDGDARNDMTASDDDDNLSIKDETEKDSDNEEMNDSDNSDDAMSDNDSDSSEISPPPKQLKHANLEDGCVLFIRNLNYDTVESSLYNKFKQFGPVRYARIVMEQIPDNFHNKNKKPNNDTSDKEDEEDEEVQSLKKRSKGVAFVCFYKPEDAQRVLKLCNSNNNLNINEKENKENKKSSSSSSSLLSSMNETGLTLDNRQLNITLAVSKNAAQSFITSTNQKLDKRNLYLAREGVILSSSDAAQSLNDEELKRREKYYREKKKKLENPNFIVSKVRLSVRNLPLELDEKSLKTMFINGIKTAIKIPEQRIRSETFTPIHVKQVKIARDALRPGLNGLGRSKRYGFIEFTCHEHAMMALRHINNNPGVWRQFGGGRPIVEFAVDDVRKLKERDQKHSRLIKMREMKQIHDENKINEEKSKAEEELKKSTKSEQKKQARKNGTCYKCGGSGHQARKCKKKPSENNNNEEINNQKEIKNEIKSENKNSINSSTSASKSPINGKFSSNESKSSKRARTETEENPPSSSSDQISNKKLKSSPITANQNKNSSKENSIQSIKSSINEAKLKSRQLQKPPNNNIKSNKTNSHQVAEDAAEARFDSLVNDYRNKFLTDYEEEPTRKKWFE